MPLIRESNKSRVEIEIFGNFFNMLIKLTYPDKKPKIALEEFVKEMGGKIRICSEYAGPILDYPRIKIKKQNDFIINLSGLSSPIRDYFTIAQALGIYFLHANLQEFPNKETEQGFGGWETISYQSKSFAAALTMPFVEYLETRNKLKKKEGLLNEFELNIMLGAHFHVSSEDAKSRYILYQNLINNPYNL